MFFSLYGRRPPPTTHPLLVAHAFSYAMLAAIAHRFRRALQPLFCTQPFYFVWRFLLEHWSDGGRPVPFGREATLQHPSARRSFFSCLRARSRPPPAISRPMFPRDDESS